MVARRTVARWIVPQWWQARALAAACAFGLFGLAGCGSSQEGVSPPRATSSGVPGPVAAGLAECARQGAARLHPASYEIHFNVHVVPGGEARLVEVVSSTLGDRGLEECMKGAFRSVAW